MPGDKGKSPLRILIVDDELNIRKMLATSLELDGHAVIAVSNGQDAVDQVSRGSFDMAFVDLRLGMTSGIDLIPALLAQSPWLRIVVITAHGSIDTAVETMRRGATDYLTKPFTPGQVRLVVDRVSKLRSLEQQVAGLEDLLDRAKSAPQLQSESPLMRRALAAAQQIAKSDSTVLLRGESGTGKNVVARAMHLWSDRAESPFATVSAPTLSPQLLESELFGHVKGAFTGAIRDNPGRIAACAGGTLFLDEIGDLPRELQPKLLRFIQDREYERIGESIARKANVRIITATNVNLEQAVQTGAFREDLFYRINVAPIDLPPLRDRPEDIVKLAEQFLHEFRKGKAIAGFTDEALKAMTAYRWPGNTRELRNMVERAVILSQRDHIGVEDLSLPTTLREVSVAIGDHVSLEQIEELHIRRVLAKSPSLETAAGILGIDAATLWRRRKKYGI